MCACFKRMHHHCQTNQSPHRCPHHSLTRPTYYYPTHVCLPCCVYHTSLYSTTILHSTTYICNNKLMPPAPASTLPVTKEKEKEGERERSSTTTTTNPPPSSSRRPLSPSLSHSLSCLSVHPVSVLVSHTITLYPNNLNLFIFN